ncbi:sodium-dependent transporter bedraggled isoform X2 [Diabrotica virgifera virgifera]|nr:sodium-dependent transporter bedraggled isoform X2 [Diabrotica virgifera virgifera]XP_050515605.1 sodium-dependent transporter bedraggled isoform X2 [Diabrotica virgifera virgifera]
MSTETSTNEGDLIDLHVGSPVLPRALPISTSEECSEASDNLLDTELPVLEEKLQTASQLSTPKISSRRPSVDVEDILIDIDDNYDEVDGLDDNEEFIEVCDNIEALNVLKNLDEVLDATFQDDDSSDASSVQVQQDIEECLEDLDNYLKTLEGSSSEDECVSSNCTDDQASAEGSIVTDCLETEIPSEENEESKDEELRCKLRQIEENYRKYLASGCVNKAYVETEPNERERRPLSACGAVSEAKSRNHPARNTVAVVRRKRPSLPEAMDGAVASRCSPKSRKPRPAAESDEDIDWSWVQDVARDITLERRAHAAADCCTGTVVLEAPRITVVPSSSSAPTMDEEPKEDANKSTWLRSSMRRLRHLPLPNGDVAPGGELSDAAAPVEDVAVHTSGRPVSAPSRIPASVVQSSARPSRSRSRESEHSAVSHEPSGRARSSSASSRSRRPRSVSSSETSLPSTIDSTSPSTPVVTPHTPQEPETETTSPRRSCDRNRQSDMPEADSPLGHWPHSLSSMMACLGCTLGLFNISRFSILTVHFGANFIFQFCFLSLVFGLPLFTLQLCLGQQLGAGVIDMWRISPLFQGVGVSLLLAQALMGLYSIIGVSWMFVFFRDSFITKMDRYRWAEPFIYYRRDIDTENSTFKLSETLPDYFNGVVLQRHHLPSGTSYGTIKFQLAFNLAVVWMIVFVSLSKGLRSYGKVIYVFTLVPVFGTFILCAKILGLMPPEYVNVIFPETSWGEFFLNPKSWLAASQEVFLTWGLLGAAVMQIASHNRHKHLLQRDSSLVAVITFTILLLVAFLANTCVQILKAYGYTYLPDSFESMASYTFLRSTKDALPHSLSSTPVRNMPHNSFNLGERVLRPNVDFSKESGYMVLRLATELVPATFAVMGADQVSPFWAVLFYFILIMFGIAQQLAIWHCVITGIMAIKAQILKSWETTITFFSCACGFILGLPMATEMGIYVVYFFDYTVGGIWWLVIVIIIQIMAVFMVRGRPYSGDTVVTALFYQNNHPCVMSWAPAMLSFTWNVILPVALMVLCISTFKNGNFRDMFIWHHAPLAEYWPLWARQVGSMIQLIPILCIPLVAVIQSYRYLNNGSNDILERIQLLYRPPIGEHMDDVGPQEAAEAIRNENNAANAAAEDPPPKYTPPPSYTTATGARIAKFLRQSIRRSVRRIANVLGEGSSRQRTPISNTNGTSTTTPLPPPDYNAVLVEMNNPSRSTDVAISMPDGPATSTRLSTLERLRNLESTSTALTAAEVASILRSSFRRSTVHSRNNSRITNFSDNMASLSAQNLIDSAAPIGEMSLVMERLPSSDFEVKHTNNNTSSVI